MGTSKQLPTPSGGPWTPLKGEISKYLDGDDKVTPSKIVGDTVQALGGLNVPSPGRSGSSSGSSSRSGGGGGSGGGGRGGGGGGSGRSSSSRSSVGKAASGLGGFGAAVREGGLDAGLTALGLEELSGKEPAEVIDRICDHLAEGTDPTQYDLLTDALKGAIVEAAALGEQAGFKDLDSALQSFLEQRGVEGLIESYLANYVYDRVWMAIENHVEMKTAGSSNSQSMSIAVNNACRSHVQSLIQDTKTAGRFDKVDWFGRDGARLGGEIVSDLEGRLRGG